MKEIITIQQQVEISYETSDGRKKCIEDIKQDANWISLYKDWTDRDKAKGLTPYGAVKINGTTTIINN